MSGRILGAHLLPPGVLAWVVVALFAFAPAFAGQSAGGQAAPPLSLPPEDPKLKDWKPAIFPAEAVAYGAALEAAAPPKLKAWCEEFARREMPKRKIDPRDTMAVVDQQFPKNSDEARDAAIFLLTYLAYKEEDYKQRQTVVQIRRLDDEASDIMLQSKLRRDDESKRLASTRTTVSPQQMMRNTEEDQQGEQRLRELGEKHKQRMRELETSRRRIDGYLKVMGVTHPRMKGIEPSALKEFQ